jgi:glycerophosphoryl diester phosphodiesterase
MPEPLEIRTMELLQSERVIDRTVLRSFDHRSLRALRLLEPAVTTAVLVARTAPVEPAQLAINAGAQIYCPDFEFLDERQVQQLHAAQLRVIPWTVNEPEACSRLTDWGVDGVTTDFPNRLTDWRQKR